jgi:formylglycine-generating enzyme required for sulfatase activity
MNLRFSIFCFLLMLFLSGCILFKTPLKDRLEPMEMTTIEGGTFIMGDVIYEENDDATPLHEVTLKDYLIGTYEVTYSQYDRFAEETDRPLPPDDGRGRGSRAVVHVSWYDAVDFCEAYGYRLPTEQEWEFAARSRGKDHIYAGAPTKDMLDEVARYQDNSGPYTFNVGTKKPTEQGIYDMSGNVSEYIGAYYPFYRTNPDSLEYHPLNERQMRVIRGGNFNRTDSALRTYWRTGVLGDLSDHTTGFRCAASLE